MNGSCLIESDSHSTTCELFFDASVRGKCGNPFSSGAVFLTDVLL